MKMHLSFGLRGLSALAFLLAFNSISAAQSLPKPLSAEEAIKQADKSVDAIVAIPAATRTFKNTVLALDDLLDLENSQTSLFVFMEQVSPDAAIRNQARDADEMLTNWQNALNKRADLFHALQEYASKGESLTPLQDRLLKFTLRDFRRSGMDLAQAERDKLQALDEKLSKLTIEFEQNIADDDSTVIFTKEELSGVPQKFLDGWTYSQGVYLVTLNESSVQALLFFPSQEETRKKAWFAFKRRGGPKNVAVLKQVLKLRAERAKMLGYPNTAAFELETRMAKNAQNIFAFYQKLKPIVRKKALVDFKQFQDTKRKLAQDPKAIFHPWDQAYIKSYLQKTQYSMDSAKVAEYFPADEVLSGLFSISEKLYGISFKDVSSHGDQYGKKLWANGVKYLEVDDRKTGNVLGHLYLDLYPRSGKYTHAACFPLIERKSEPDGTLQLPIAALVVNVAQKTAKEPALLSHDDVETIFHEFGHCLHNVLTESTISRFSGSNVELDFVEAPSQMFENWVWSPEVLKTFAKHYKTGQVIPDSLLKGMIATRSLGSGIETEHQTYYGIVDQKYYSAPAGDVDTTKVGIDTMHEVELYEGIPGTMFEASFDHLMNYDAGYYSYLWSLVYAQDMFGRFKKMGLLSPEAGAYYRTHVLAKGGTQDSEQTLHDYLGRAPRFEPFLEHLGMPSK